MQYVPSMQMIQSQRTVLRKRIHIPLRNVLDTRRKAAAYA